jgi:hypothetical protein
MVATQNTIYQTCTNRLPLNILELASAAAKYDKPLGLEFQLWQSTMGGSVMASVNMLSLKLRSQPSIPNN